MDWSALSATNLSELHSHHDLLGEVFQFILSNDIPAQVQGVCHCVLYYTWCRYVGVCTNRTALKQISSYNRVELTKRNEIFTLQ